ncbi:hypothetical protein KEN51_CDS0045 [Pseudomonas phage vB_Pae10145-KEN51]|uniref:PHIKZ302 n=6 Tax=Viruses TaxID=10239 RepID=Q8SCL0_BPDPK|nr:PHIKZ302 [Pseudomonas phage phiKZ]YP_009617329.1 hypothetical protein FDI90_gp041 [Pseudomonas phage PA7]YP_009619552.1 hypothetical protein FDJ06_gp012 [Pseudomonas phage SL2]ANM45122.1 hypothetical protein KTN4_364 [Pseudomonas phage KTN4]QJB22999.1 hypothetical protein fnug_356 [Pseudomonas phage fnug]QOV08195.1 hypothetical protein [Pseudomonas phage vB_PaeM_kmuB]UNI71880.1 hypothetical protein Churi01_gp356 [Pseudomonas phage Churi01]UXD83687.1 hypothetical protein NP274_00280 [Pseud
MIKNELLPGLIYAQKEFDKIAANVKDYDKYKRREAGRASAVLRSLVSNIVNQNKPSSLEHEGKVSTTNTNEYLEEVNNYFFNINNIKLISPKLIKEKLTIDLMNIYVKWNMIGVAGRNDVPIIEHRINDWCEVTDVYINGNKITSLQWPR